MHIGIDGGCWNNRRGYGRFLRELLQAIAERTQSDRFSVFLDKPSFDSFHLPEPFRPVLVKTSQAVADAATADKRRSLADLLRMSRAVARERLDLFFFPSVYSYFPLLRRIPMVLGIHDTIADRNPHLTFASRRQERFWRWKVRLALAQADRIVTVSEYSQKCIEETLGVSPPKIRVLYEAASPVFRKLGPATTDTPYILYVGGISPNKNLAVLIRAFAKLPARPSGLKLVLAGDYHSDGFKGCYQELQELIRSLSLERQVSFPGYVPDEELCLMYNHASMFVLPSLDEGFGLPAMEAMACGAPVIVSSGNALQEIVGDAGLIIDPRDESALAAAIEKILSDGALAQELSKKSLQRSAQFSWTRTAEQLLQIFAE